MPEPPAPPSIHRRSKAPMSGRISLGCTEEFRSWLYGLADHLGEPDLADLLRAAVKAHAAASGFTEVMPKR